MQSQPVPVKQGHTNEDTKMAYTGFELTEKDRAMLAARFSPRFPDFIGHHVTWEFGVENAELPAVDKLEVVGYACDGSLECLVVRYAGTTRRPDGGTLHITWSLDRSAGRKPVDSNTLLATAGFWAGDHPITLTCVPTLFK